MKTRKQIQAMVDLLTFQKAGIPKVSMFGDDNHEKIDAQVRALVEVLKNPDPSVIRSLSQSAYDNENDPRAEAFDWAMGELSDDLVDADDNWVKIGRGVK